MQTEHDKALDSAKINLICRPDSVFISTILFSLRFDWDEAIPTACTNGVYLKVNPTFFLSLTKGQRIFLLAHESYHVALQHMARLNGRIFRIWNFATDYVINQMLVDSGFEFIPSGLLDSQYRLMDSYEVYDILVQKPESELPQDFEEDFEEMPTDNEQAKSIEESIQETIIKASIQAKIENQAGTIPGEVEIFLDKLVSPKLPWHKILANCLNTFAQDDHTFSKPNRRYLPKYYMPTRYSETIGEIAVAVDLSGSITQTEANIFISEIHSIHNMVKPSKTHVVGFDTEITMESVIQNRTDLLKLKFVGGGGTLIQPVYEWAKINKPKLLIIFTDGYFDKAEEEIPKGIPIFWVIHGHPSFNIKKGKVITY
jgi:predicted metal-dependent peptidase